MRDVAALLPAFDEERMRRDLFHLAQHPLPCRRLNCTLPGHARATLHEADDFLTAELERAGYAVRREACRVQAWRPGPTLPEPDDPWYEAFNLYAQRAGRVQDQPCTLLLAHKDSQSWVDSPGAYDNAVGTVALLEIARVLAAIAPRATVRFLFCNEEHWPWTSVRAAREARRHGVAIRAVFNLDGVGRKSPEDAKAGLRTNVTAFAADEGEALADLMAEVNRRYAIGLAQRKARRPRPHDDDGSFVQAGYPAAVINIGSFPSADPTYHTPGDTPERVDIGNVRMVAQATLAAVLHLDAGVTAG